MKIPGEMVYNILVVDDDPAVGNAIKHGLERCGHVIETAESGPLALELFAAGRFDLVLADYGMSGMTGEVLALILKRLQPGLPILLITGNSPSKVKLDQFGGAVDGLLFKPFTQTDLISAVRNLLR
jgi:CheY-like chemotaxis protein